MNSQEIREYGIMLLAENGYRDGECNYNNVRAFSICNEFGNFAVSIGANEQEALDNACNENKLDCMAMSPPDYNEYSENGWDDSYILLGNASEPFWSEYLSITPL